MPVTALETLLNEMPCTMKGVKADEGGKRTLLSPETTLYKQFQRKPKAMKGDLKFIAEGVF